MTRTRISIALAAAMLCHGSAAVPPPPVIETPRTRSEVLLYELELGGYWSDNRALTTPKSDPGFVLLPRLSFNLFRQGGRIEAQARGMAEYYQWLEDPGDGDLRLRLALAADGAIVPGLFHWTVQNNADMRATDFTRPAIGDNLQQINVFTTGPSLRLRPHGIWSGLVEANYANTYAEEMRDFNSHRLIGSAWLRYKPHERRQFALGVQGTDVQFRHDSPTNPDYDRVDLMARYRSDFRQFGFELVGGRTRISFADGEELSGPMFRGSARIELGENHQLAASAVREYSDTARDLMTDAARFDRPREGRGRSPVRPSQFRVEGADISWRGRFDRTTLWVNSYERDYDYPFELASDPMSHRARGVAAQVGHALNATQSIRFDALFERRRFKADGRVDHDVYYGVHFDQRLGERWSLRTGVTRFDPDADELGARWVEHMVSVALVRHGGL
jgi:hypothetical protein